MESNWAAENLQTIRTLMERSAIYRRALAPVSTCVGMVGIAAAVVGWQLKLETDRSFLIYWMAVSLVAISGALLLVRRQALKDHEPFWSPPTRRIVQAMFPALLVGFLGGVLEASGRSATDGPTVLSMLFVPIWSLFYGLALHSAGFFMPRGIRLFGWGFLIAGLVLSFGLAALKETIWNISPMLLMGVIFGGFHF